MNRKDFQEQKQTNENCQKVFVVKILNPKNIFLLLCEKKNILVLGPF